MLCCVVPCCLVLSCVVSCCVLFICVMLYSVTLYIAVPCRAVPCCAVLRFVVCGRPVRLIAFPLHPCWPLGLTLSVNSGNKRLHIGNHAAPHGAVVLSGCIMSPACSLDIQRGMRRCLRSCRLVSPQPCEYGFLGIQSLLHTGQHVPVGCVWYLVLVRGSEGGWSWILPRPSLHVSGRVCVLARRGRGEDWSLSRCGSMSQIISSHFLPLGPGQFLARDGEPRQFCD